MSEVDCTRIHLTVEDAINCARQGLNMTQQEEHPMIGMKNNNIGNVGWIIGFSDRAGTRRWRLDYDPEKGAHVNEEDVRVKGSSIKVCHRISYTGEYMMRLWWRKFTSAGLSGYDNPPVRLSQSGPEPADVFRYAINK